MQASNENIRKANYSYCSPRGLSPVAASPDQDANPGYMSPKLRANVNQEYRAAKTVGKKNSGLNSLD